MDPNFKVKISQKVLSLAKELKEDFKLSDFEALSIALKAEQNAFFKRAFVLYDDDSVPTALEAIKNALE